MDKKMDDEMETGIIYLYPAEAHCVSGLHGDQMHRAAPLRQGPLCNEAACHRRHSSETLQFAKC